ncbi:LETM1 domain-containing protein ylh47, partial [Cryomyces antarcticus]
MSLNRSATKMTPLLLRSGSRAVFRRTPRSLPRHLPAIAILLPQYRGVSTETSASSGGNFPPPGFNAEEAKKPLPKDQKQDASPSVDKAVAQPDPKDVKVPKDLPTGSSKTKAAEARSLKELEAVKIAGD